MHIAQIVYNVVSVLLLSWICFAWSSKDAVNQFIKQVFFFAAIFGIVMAIKSMGVF